MAAGFLMSSNNAPLIGTVGELGIIAMGDEFYDDSGGVITLDPFDVTTTLPPDDTDDILNYWNNVNSTPFDTIDNTWDGDDFNLDNIDTPGYVFTGPVTPPNSNTPAVPPTPNPNQSNNSPRPNTGGTTVGPSGGSSGGSTSGGSSSATNDINKLLQTLSGIVSNFLKPPAVTPGTTPATQAANGISPTAIVAGAALIAAALYFR